MFSIASKKGQYFILSFVLILILNYIIIKTFSLDLGSLISWSNAFLFSIIFFAFDFIVSAKSINLFLIRYYFLITYIAGLVLAQLVCFQMNNAPRAYYYILILDIIVFSVLFGIFYYHTSKAGKK